MHPLAVALGGALGTLLRLLLTQGGGQGAWDPRISVVNVVGAFLLGVLVRLPLHPRLRAFLAPGALGAFTSFSALSIAFVDSTPRYAVWLGFVVSIVLGIAAAALGMGLGHLLVAAEEDDQ